MLRMSWSTFRDRWQVFAGAIITVCIGVALVQASLLSLVSAANALSRVQQQALREGYEGAVTLLAMILGLAAFIAVFIVASTFAFTVAQRRRDLALLRLAGAGRGQVRVLLLGEALLLGTVGSALGIALGVPVMRAQDRLLDHFALVPPGFAGAWRSWIVAVSFGTGVGIALAGVLVAARRAARVRPLEALRETGAAARVMTASRWILGLFFLAGGVAMLLLVPMVESDGAVAMAIFVSAVLVTGFAALAPLAVPLISWLPRLLARGHLGQLAHANLRSGVRRSASTAAPIMVLVAFVAGLGGAMNTVGVAGQQELTRSMRADLVLTADRPEPAGGSLSAEVAGVDGVRTVSAEVPVDLDVRTYESDGQYAYQAASGVAVDPMAYTATHRLDVSEGSLAGLRVAGTAAIGTGTGLALHPRVGGTLRVRLADGQSRDLRIVALLPPTLATPYLLLSPDLAPATAAPRRYVVQLADGADAAAVTSRLARLGQVVTVPAWIRQYSDDQQRMNINIMVALLGMAMLYTVIAMVNAVVISASDRREEFATARVAGLTRAQVVRVALWEALAVVAIGLLLGGLAAAGTVAGMAVAIGHMIGLRVVSVQWPLLGALALGAAVIVGISSVLTTLAATRTPAIRLVAARE